MSSIPLPICTIEIDQVNEREWNEHILHFEDATINQTWSFGASLSGARNLSHLVMCRSGELVAAAQVRLARVPILGYGMAYLAWGPLWQQAGVQRDFEALGQILRAIRSEYAIRRRLYLEIKPHLWEGDPDADRICQVFAESGFQRLGSEDRTVLRLMEPSLAEIRQQLAQKWRNQLNYAEKHGVTAVAGKEDELFDRFMPVYREMVSRKGYENPVDIDRFATMRKGLSDALGPLIVLAGTDEAPMAGGVFSVMGNTGIYLLGATSDPGLACKASYLVQWRAIEWMKGSEIKVYDLGGTDRLKTPGTYHFKAGVCGKDAREVARLGNFIACSNPVSQATVRLGKALRRWRRL